MPMLPPPELNPCIPVDVAQRKLEEDIVGVVVVVAVALLD